MVNSISCFRTLNFVLCTIFSLMVVLLVGCNKKAVVDEHRNQISYALGIQTGRAFRQQEMALSEEDFTNGFHDGFADKNSDLSDVEIQKLVVQAQLERQQNKNAEILKREQEGKDYLEKNSLRKEVQTLGPGVQFEILHAGTGAQPKQGERVALYLKGMLPDGQVFVDDFAKKKPQQLTVLELIPGLRMGVLAMKSGSRYRFFLSPELGHGMRGRDGVPAQSVVIYDLELAQIISEKKKR